MSGSGVSVNGVRERKWLTLGRQLCTDTGSSPVAPFNCCEFIFFMEKSVMCTGSPSSIVVPSIAPRDTSNEMIKSNYELSEENKKKNAEIAARNKAKSLVSFGGNDNDTPSGLPANTQVGNTGTFRPQTFEDKTGLYNVG